MKNYSTIEITYKNGESVLWTAENWDDYAYDGKVFIVKKNEEWVGIYNMDCVVSVVVKSQEASR